MIRYIALASILLCTPATAAESDELAPVPSSALIGRQYCGDTAPSRIRFINLRDRAVRITWIALDGARRPYGTLAPGGEMVQPTFLAHRWVVEDAADGQPLYGFISTRSAARDEGATPIALIR
ncbi:MAG TPA: hypothetical protein VD768_03640 [Sphingomicrobium sp.]|nr:hypothetical protein [Sphingomicrobium sp.]